MATKETLFITIFGWTLCIFSWLVCAPIMTYFFIRLYEQRNEILIYKRYPLTTLVTYIIVMVDVILQKTFFALYQMELIANDYILLCISIGLLPFVYYGFTYAILWKFYLLFYEINYSKESMNDGWKNIINPESGTKSFFLEHHETYGNFHWISKRIILSAIICIVISYILWTLGLIEWWKGSYTYFRIASGVDLFLVSLPLVFMVWMYFKTPAFYDYFSVRTELKITFIILCIYYVAIVFIQLEVVWIRVFGLFTVNSRIYSLIHTLITIICQFAIILIQTSWTLSKLQPYLKIKWERTKSKIQMEEMVLKASEHNDEMMDKQTVRNTNANANANANANPMAVQFSNDISDISNNMLGIHDVLSNTSAFDAFMLHIVKEFSVEILLSYVEITQFLQYLFNNFDDMISSQVHDTSINETLIDLPESVPESYIISAATKGIGMIGSMRKQSKNERKQSRLEKERNPSTKTKKDVLLLVLFIGSSLYNKYVKHNADLEINISSMLRKQFTQMFTGHNEEHVDVDLDLNKVIQLFCDCNKSMYRLLSYSFSRFKAKKDFERLCETSFSNAKSSNSNQLKFNSD